MSLDSVKSVLSKSLSQLGTDFHYDELLSTLRQLRNAAATEGRDFQLSVLRDEELTSNLVLLLDDLFKRGLPDTDTTLAFNIGVQCIVNLMNDNDVGRKLFAEKYLPTLTSWFGRDNPKTQNYVAAALLNIDKVNGLDLSDKKFLELLVLSGESGVEFSVHLLQNLLKSHNFIILYEVASSEGKLFLLHLLESAIPHEPCGNDFVEDIKFICGVYKKSCDDLMVKISSVSLFSAHELASMLEFLASLSYKPAYMEVMQSDASLVISSAYLLRGIHECVSHRKNWKESLQEAVDVVKNKKTASSEMPFFGVKGDLIRLLGNLAYKNKMIQDRILEAGCVPILLDSCKLDGENPFIKEWSILAIRNLCDGNLEIQQFIKDMELKGYDVVEDLSLTLDSDNGTNVNIAPLRKL